GARLINSFLGSNSTVSCCEILNNLIFPFHEQHHNNSFLTASTLLGQSNIAAGATIGSNHNSRANDGEILAGRGFWPGLSSSFKHNSRFASFTLIAKGSYSWELNITMPFCLVSMREDQSTIQVMPGYWFLYNMFALERNSRKFRLRDKRVIKEQNIEFDYLAPDTAEEMAAAMEVLRRELRKAFGSGFNLDKLSWLDEIDDEPLLLDGFVPKRKAYIVKPIKGYLTYKAMLMHYGAKELKKEVERALKEVKGVEVAAFVRDNFSQPYREWNNIGGQLIPETVLQKIMKEITEGKINSWRELHKEYDRQWDEYPKQKKDHAIYMALLMHGKNIQELDNQFIRKLLSDSRNTARVFSDLAWKSREKDFTNPFRQTTYRNKEEMTAVLGRVEDIDFLKDFRKEVEEYSADIGRLVAAME
ncbi:MAG: DUF4954 family protein, partial [Spirochaetota bacterium]